MDINDERMPVCWRREWDGDNSDLGTFVHADSHDELDELGPWEALYSEMYVLKLEQRLAAAEECLRSRNCDDLCLVHIQRAEAVEKELEQCRVQLAGCSVAALGCATGENEAKPGDYGYSVAYQDVANLRSKWEAAKKELEEAHQAAAKISLKFVNAWKRAEAAETALQAAREAAIEECAKLCETNDLLSGSIGPLMNAGWAMCQKNCAAAIRSIKP